ncbi:RBBP9/YdeN family alpha/beta hydrolase [Xenorhabdus szentirmaii]|uniref:Serine hydrolase family protein n=1 Tax=Xenorhabdus szentirmaii TaxID=290112 RepID=A0AAW3Z1G1_9GAMM|nr:MULTISPECIES: alpha/beta hydrolase [Xenorhabdus]MBD2779836.1 serine hydrolase family protein [Xenorhabdus sp. 38]MBD2802258.1 serine hydrolase family protein [Xenorhabdus sp. M]PHM41750.1 esterase [Xenorhabdus szentirmaii]
MTLKKINHNGLFWGKRIIVIHGYTASPSSHWFPWLKEILTEQGAEVSIPEMPESSAAQPEAWANAMMDIASDIDENTILIGHSLGCITILRHLEAMRSESLRLGGYIWVAGCDLPQKALPELDIFFTNKPLDYSYLRGLTEHRFSIISSNDEIVSPQSSYALARALQTEVITIENAGHFLDREGFTRLLPVYDALMTMVSK